MTAPFFFWFFAAIVVFGAVGVVAMRQPVHSALFLLLSFFGIAALFVTLRAEFLAAVQILVYAGGIMVLFLFTIMLVNIRKTAGEPFLHRQAGGALLVAFLLLAVVGGTIVASSRTSGLADAGPARGPREALDDDDHAHGDRDRRREGREDARHRGDRRQQPGRRLEPLPRLPAARSRSRRCSSSSR